MVVVIFLIGSAIKSNFILSDVSYSDESIDSVMIKREKRWLLFFMIICALVMGLRASTVGEDTQRYMSYFNYTSSLPLGSVDIAAMNTGVDIGYAILMKIISLVYNDYIFFQLMVSIFVCLGYAYYISKNRIDISIGIAVFLGSGLFFAAFNTTRQSCALTFFLIAWTFLQERKYVKTFILIIIAVSMHMSAILFAIPAIIYIFRKHRFIYWVVPSTAIIVALFYRRLLIFLASVLPQYSHITDNNNQYMSVGLSAIVWIIVAAISLLILKKYEKYQMKEKIYAVCALFYPFFSSLGLAVNSFERLGFYFIPFISMVFDCFGKKEFASNRIIYRVIVCLCFLVWFMIASKSYPYELASLFGGAN